jgi:hypothetical protein
MIAYSAEAYKAYRKPVYSIVYPAINSDSDSMRSTGILPDSINTRNKKMLNSIGYFRRFIELICVCDSYKYERLLVVNVVEGYNPEVEAKNRIMISNIIS